MDSLVERLRAMYSHRGDGIPTQFVNHDGPEAADELTRLTAENARLRGALVEVEKILREGPSRPVERAHKVATAALNELDRI
jgi:hypothetical protein